MATEGQLQFVVSSIEKAGLSSHFGLDKLTQPKLLLHVEFSGGLSANLSNEFTPLQTKNEPKLSVTLPFGSSVPSLTQRYTIICVDPDAPSRIDTFASPVVHWAQNGLLLSPAPLSTSSSASAPPNQSYAFINKAPELMFWRGPGPPPKTGLHRYCFLIYKELSEKVIKFEDQRTMKDGKGLKGRLKFKFEEFLEQNQLELLGVNYFISQDAVQSKL